MSWLEAIVLGLTQGLTEFLPISSSGHLMIVPWLFGWESPGVAFDAALHLGTLLAVLAYFWQDLRQMVRAVPTILRKRAALLRAGAPDEDDDTFFARLGLLLIIGSIPGAVAGLALESKIDDLFHPESNQDRAIVVIAILLAVFGVVLWLADRYGRENRILRSVRLPDTLVVGIAQALALMPGTSRSGVTLTAGLFRGFQRAHAARFSFLLGIPLIAGAGLKGVADLLQADPSGAEIGRIVAGMATSAISGFITIRFLLRYLQTSSTGIFVVYRLIASIVLIVLVVTGVR
jgi:undecaprenyl-diphosphatase